jgi:AraC family transcriptional regulator, exoenzyme S synthesis regulatory protein ExsA
MKTHESQYVSPEIKLSSFDEQFFSSEILLDHHALVWFLSGEAKIVLADSTHIFRPGDIILFPRNQLATFVNYPKDDRPFKSVVLNLTVDRLKDFYIKHDSKSEQTTYYSKIFSFKKHPLLDSFLSSLMPYFEMQDVLPENIVTIKVEEAINILRTIEPDIDDLLANFEMPGKINLADFMEKNYMFNMTLDKFARLTGRSLTTFKRDFKKAFKTTPQRWLTQKRLELAHYQLIKKKRKPGEVYFEAGFENLSHFSYAFKKHFGYNPTEIKQRRL